METLKHLTYGNGAVITSIATLYEIYLNYNNNNAVVRAQQQQASAAAADNTYTTAAIKIFFGYRAVLSVGQLIAHGGLFQPMRLGTSLGEKLKQNKILVKRVKNIWWQQISKCDVGIAVHIPLLYFLSYRHLASAAASSSSSASSHDVVLKKALLCEQIVLSIWGVVLSTRVLGRLTGNYQKWFPSFF